MPRVQWAAQSMEREELNITAQLARLELSEEDTGRFEQEVARMLEYFSKMKELDVQQLPPPTQMTLKNRTREDRVLGCDNVDSLLANAPELEDRFIVIPNVL